MSGSIAERGREVVEEFAGLDDWTDRYTLLIEQAKTLPLLEEAYHTDAYRVRGCQSQVWLRATREPAPAEAGGDRLFFRADSDAIITKGLVALLVRVLDGQPAAEIARADLGFLEEVGLREHLSPGRANGLAAMVARMKAYAGEVRE